MSILDKTTIRIGKNGITEPVVREIKKTLEKKGTLKIKFLKAALKEKNRKMLAQEISEKTDSEMLKLVGNVVILHKI